MQYRILYKITYLRHFFLENSLYAIILQIKFYLQFYHLGMVGMVVLVAIWLLPICVKTYTSNCKSYNFYMGIENKFWEFDFFFKKNVFYSYERARWVGHKNRSPMSQKLILDLKISWRSKKGPKIAKLFPWFLTTWFELLFQN